MKTKPVNGVAVLLFVSAFGDRLRLHVLMEVSGRGTS